MNRILLILLILFTGSNFSQSFFSLDGIETPTGETILLYHLGNPEYREYTPLYKYDVITGNQKKIMDAYYLNESYTRSVQDYEFFPGDTSNFINCGFGRMPDNYGFIAYNDSSVFGFQEMFMYADISQQNPSRTYAEGDGLLNRSFDGGLTYPQDSVLNFHMISVSEFNDNEIFGIDDHNKLIKSFDGGHTSIIVSDIPVHEDPYFLPKLYYEQDQMHIYRINKSYDQYNLYVSDNRGNSYTWQLKSGYPQPFVFANDPSINGTCYLAYYYNLYKSTDYAESFLPYHHFDERIMGIYPKPGTQILYVATRYHLYKLENDTITTLKVIPPDPEMVKYYPLQVGNLWVYDGFTWDFPDYEIYQFIRKVNDAVIKPNQKNYFEVEETIAGSGYSRIYYERVDTTDMKLYRYDGDSVQSGQEYLVDDLRAEPGDSVMSYRFETYAPYSVVYSSDTTLFNEVKASKIYESTSLISYQYRLVKDFGMTNIMNGYDFGVDYRDLKGAVLNGTAFGDTTIVGIDEQVNPAGTYSLSQNYPNPFNPVTSIQYAVGSMQFVTLKVYDVLGNEVADLVNEEKPAGMYTVEFDGSKLSSGIYFYRIEAGGYTQSHKMILLK